MPFVIEIGVPDPFCQYLGITMAKVLFDSRGPGLSYTADHVLALAAESGLPEAETTRLRENLASMVPDVATLRQKIMTLGGATDAHIAGCRVAGCKKDENGQDTGEFHVHLHTRRMAESEGIPSFMMVLDLLRQCVSMKQIPPQYALAMLQDAAMLPELTDW